MSGTWPASPAPQSARLIDYEPSFSSLGHSLRRQVRSRGGERFGLELKYASMERADFAPLFAFAAKQYGQADTFTVVLPGELATQRGTGGGAPVVDNEVGSPTIVPAGRTIYTKAWSPFVIPLLAMDFFKFAGHAKIYMLTDDAAMTDSGGRTQLSFKPDLMQAPAHGEAITYANVSMTVSLTQDSLAFLMTPGVNYQDFSVQFIEVPDGS